MNFLKSFIIVFNFYQLGSTQIPLIFKSRFGLHPNPDRCRDFYKLSCQDWWRTTKKLQHEPVWNRWTQASNEINKRIDKILDVPTRNLDKPQIFYRSCLKSDRYESDNLDNLRQLIRDFGGWPLVDKSNNYSGTLSSIIKLNRIFDVSPIFKFHIDIDYKNTTQYAFYIEPGNLIYPQQILLKPSKYSTELRTYEEWILNTIKHIYKNQQIGIKSIKDLIKFEMELAKFQERPKIERLPIRKFVKKFPFNLLEMFNAILFENQRKLTKNDVIIIRNYDYFKNILSYFTKIDNEIVQNYLIWYFVKDLSRDTTKYLRNLNFLIDKTILGVDDDFQRSFECTDRTIKIFDYKIAKFYEEFYLDSNWRRNIENIFTNIQKQFVDLIENRPQHLSREVCSLIVEKIEKIRLNLGYPQWINTETLDDYYGNLKISHNHFVNVLQIKLWKSTKNYNKLGQNFDKIEWPTSIFEVNAYYSILQNSIFVPLGLIIEPFYTTNRPLISNYGALGALIGHELSHSVDPIGRQADQNGNVRQWWPKQDLINYQRKLKCFNHANNEEIADHVGIKISLNAYRNATESANFEEFFTSFAQMWCDFGDKIDIFDDNHPIMSERARRTLQNNHEFAKIFHCNKGDQICELW